MGLLVLQRPQHVEAEGLDLDEYVYDALRAGASGFLLKDVPAEQLVDGIRVIAEGDALLAPVGHEAADRRVLALGRGPALGARRARAI